MRYLSVLVPRRLISSVKSVSNKWLKMESEQDEYASDKTEDKPARLSLHLIVKRHLPPDADKWPQDKIVEALNKITHLRLDRERIGEIDGLELLGTNVTNVYLQVNLIKQIENLESLKNLSFLSLANNRICKIENLTMLHKLLFLDLSENQISKVDVDELPQSMIILNLKGNPCTHYPDYRGRIVQEMPKLQQLDLCEVSKEEKREAGFQVSSDEDDEEEVDEEEENGDRETGGGNGNGFPETFQNIATGMMIRSQKRMEDMLKVHKQRVSEMDDLRITWDVPPSSRSTARSSVSESTAVRSSKQT